MNSALLVGCIGLRFAPVGGLYDPVKHIESARLYGNIDAYAYYFVDLLVGSPPQRASVILDTGSGLTAFPCAGCPHCGKHIDPNFDISKSTSAKWTPCGTKECRGACQTGHCSYRQSYQEGSSISGFWFSDLVRFGDSFQNNPPISANLGCHQNENKLFYTQKANGIFGIQGTKTVLQLLFDDHEHIESKIFSICLSEWGGMMTVGGHNETYHRSEIQNVKLIGSRYGVALNHMTVDGKKITGFRNSVIDSGTTYTYMASAAYKGLRAAIESYCDRKGNCGKRSNTCWKVPTLHDGLKNFPNVEVQLDAVVSIWEPRAYLYRKGNSDSFCYGFENDGANAPTVLGASWMLYKEVIFDLRSNMAGIAAADCPSFKDRPAHDPSRVSLPPPAMITPATPFTKANEWPPASVPEVAPGPAPQPVVPSTPPIQTQSPETASKVSTTAPSEHATTFLPMAWRGNLGPGKIAIGSVAVVTGAIAVVSCITRIVSRKPDNIKRAETRRGAGPNTFGIGDEEDEPALGRDSKPLE